jgi:hypothetical protein
MIKDSYPLFSIEDVHMIMGYEKGHVTDLRFSDNPIYTFNKKIFENLGVQTFRFGKL